MEVRRLKLSEWGEVLPAEGVEVFHLPRALQVLETHSDTELRLYGGFHGDRPVALFPIFLMDGPLMTRSIFSPPPGMNVPHLGPLFMPASPKQSTREQRNHEFVESVLDELDIDPWTLFFSACPPSYQDPRPFNWMGLTAEPRFTFHLNLEGRSTNEVLESFSQSRRREIRDGEQSDVSIERGDRDDAHAIYRATERRYAQQNEPYHIEWDYVTDLLDALEDQHRVYVARTGAGDTVGGMIVLYSNEAAYFWLGGVRNTAANVDTNSLLHWTVIRDILDDSALDSIQVYDMVGAGKRRLSQYKAKFGPTLRPYYVVRVDSLPMTVATEGYSRLNSLKATLDGTLPELL